MTGTAHRRPTYSGPNDSGSHHVAAHHVVHREAVVVGPELVGDQSEIRRFG